MQWIVQLALRRPYTFVVMSILIAFLGVLTSIVTPKDIFPSIDIPVMSVVWNYTGMSPDDVEKRLITNCENAMTTTVDNIEHLESQSLYGVGVVKIFFHSDVNIAAAQAQVTSIVQTILRQAPVGTTPPLVVQYNASSVPILQLGLESETLTEQQLFDFGSKAIRNQLTTVQGASIPWPYGGKVRQVMVDLEPDALLAKGLAPQDVSNAINAQNLMLPSGTAKMGTTEYQVRLNSSPLDVREINDMPIKVVNHATIYVRDVATVHDGFAPQTNAVTINGHRAVLLTVRKSGKASTLDIVSRIRGAMPAVEAASPEGLNIKLLFDQSLFVRASIYGVLREALMAAALTALMILLFLGSWRSTVVVCTTIPLAILTSICLLGLLGQTLNIMTLGGLALAVGILVDDATVEIENIHRNLGMKKGLRRSILDGAAQIATPTLVSTLSICIVFVSVIFLTGPAKYLFTPMALSVVFAMLASYLLSRTVIPNMVRSLLQGELHMYRSENHGQDVPGADFIWRLHYRFNHHFERMRASYGRALRHALEHRRLWATGFGLFFLVTLGILPFVGQDFFPSVDAGQFRLHLRVPSGTRIEETQKRFHEVEDSIRKLIPAEELDMVVDIIGIPQSGINLSFSDGSVAGPSDGEILVSLKPEHGPTSGYMAAVRQQLPHQYPDCVFFFQPGDIVSQILNFGLPTPVDIQVVGKDRDTCYQIARSISHDIRLIPGAVDVHLHQIVDEPTLDINVDRARAASVGLQQQDVANQLLLSLSGSGQASPNYWLDPKNGTAYLVAAQTPQYRIDSMEALLRTPIKGPTSAAGQLLCNLATVKRGLMQANITHYNVQPVFDVFANVQDRDLGGVSDDVDRILARYRKDLPRGTQIKVRGQIESMRQSFNGLKMGIVFAMVLVYLLMVVNFQSWVDPLIIVMALPGALSGIVWMLFITQTTFNVPSLMGTIMCVGVAVANSILMVTFANERQDEEGDDCFEAAWAAGNTRLRPVMMTALAMIIGMVPMALALGEGGEQNAPLGRAVIGGLLMATFTTLFLVPVAYTVMRTKPKGELDPPDPDENG